MPHECTTCGRVFADGSKEMLSGCPDCGGNKFQFKPAAATERTTSETATDEPSPESGAASVDSPGERRDLSEASSEWPDHGYGSAADSESGDPDPSPGAADRSPSAADADPSPDAADAESSPSAADPEKPAADTSAADPESAAGDPHTTTEPGHAGTTAPESGPPADGSAEDPAQADARTDVVSPDEIAAATPEEAEGTATPDAPGSPATGAGDPAADADERVPEPRPDDRPDLDDLREELNEQFESIRIVAPGEYELNLMELYDRTEYIISLQEDGRYVIEVPDTWDTTPDPDET